ncbi:MAG: hypothetical protein AAGA34_15710, partial [Pseudomonadota bacterium]
AAGAGVAPELPMSPLLVVLLAANFAAFAWRAAWRFGFTAQSHGWLEGLRAIARIPLSNVVAILAGRRAITAYALTLRGRAVEWDKTPHLSHPASAAVLPRPAIGSPAVAQESAS